MQGRLPVDRKNLLFRRRHVHRFAWCLMYALLSLFSGCGRSPAVGSEEALASADALYTAVTSRRTDLLDDVEMRLSQLQREGKLTASAARSLEQVIQQSRSGEWQAAAEDLDELIRDQPLYHHQHSSQ